MPTDEELRNIRDRKDWSLRENADYEKLGWLSRRVIDLFLKFPRVINWARKRNAPEPRSRIERARSQARERAAQAKKRSDDRP